MATDSDRCVFRAFGQEYILNKHFRLVDEIGRGSNGLICSSTYTEKNEESTIAIKKIPNAFVSKLSCKRTLRELKILRHFRGHPNIIWLFDTDIVFYPNGVLNGVYLYEELMECDLSQVIRSGQCLENTHCQSFIYQILCALKYIHSADVLHRDLKPNNLLVNSDCLLKICNFGLSRGYSENYEENNHFLTEFVATRWYRAPEIMLSYQGYTKAIDVWSTGCILAELLGGKPIFDGKDYVDQLNHILQILGTPSKETLQGISSQKVQNYIFQFGNIPRTPFESLLPRASSEGLDLLRKMLEFDPERRVTVSEALEHPYLSIWHDIDDEPSCEIKFDFEFEHIDSIEELQSQVIKEVFDFRQVVRKHPIGGDFSSSSSSSEDPILQEVADVHPSIKKLGSPNSDASLMSQLPSLTTTQPFESHVKANSGSSQGANTLECNTTQEHKDALRSHSGPNKTECLIVSSSPPEHNTNGNESVSQDTNDNDSIFFFDLEKELEFGLDGRFL
ncbi:Serine/threonine-protein kinase kdx1 [Saccharomyces pastorianus]|uniref:Mitogen-activated protein kinase n=1 Tax=Saccharomyces pastorianus TaxID=27292 RepID=A0A6C1EAM5_SACPS|nr:Serine/threonine-protein kinase kdx1 [Saccharomyces pastorianus]